MSGIRKAAAYAALASLTFSSVLPAHAGTSGYVGNLFQTLSGAAATAEANGQAAESNGYKYRLDASNLKDGTLTPTELDRTTNANWLFNSRVTVQNASNANNRMLTFSGFSGNYWDILAGHGGGGYFGIAQNGAAPYFSILATNGNVGVGTAAPGAKLHVYGNGTGESSNIVVENADAGDSFSIIRLRNAGTATDGVIFRNAPGRSTDGGANTMTIRNDAGDLRLQRTGGTGINIGNGSTYVDNLTWGNGTSRSESRDDAGLRGDAGAKSGFFETASPTNYPTGASSWWHLLDVRHSNNGNNFAMQIAGSFFDQNIYFRKTNNSASQSWSRFVGENSAGVAYVNGSLGVGTQSPTAKLDVYDPSLNNGALRGMIRFGINNTDESAAGTFNEAKPSAGIEFTRDWSNGGQRTVQAGIYGYGASGWAGGLAFRTHPSDGSAANTTATRMVINDAGNVGIGTTAPGYRLDVNGDIGTSSIYAGNWFRSTGATGWYNQTYGGGVYMDDSTWVKAYNGKGFYSAATIRADGDVRAPIFYDQDNTNYYVNPNGTSRFNDAYFDGGVASNQNASGYSNAALEIRELNFGGVQTGVDAEAPRIGFHWGGRVASQIGMSVNGRIRTFNNPGTDFEDFQAKDGYFNSVTAANLYGNATTATRTVGTGISTDATGTFRATPAHQRGFTEGYGQADAPTPGSGWWFYDSIRHSNGGNYWGAQMAYGWEDRANQIWTRNVSGNSFGAWQQIAVANGSTYNMSISGQATNLAGGAAGSIPYQSAAGTTAMLAAGTAGQYLKSNGAGAPTWANPSAPAETDPQVGSNATNYVPKWDGAALVNGIVYDNGTNVGIGTASPTTKAHVYGTLTVDPSGIAANSYSEGIRIGNAANNYSIVTFGANPGSPTGVQANQWWIGKYGGDNGFNIYGSSAGDVFHITPAGKVGIGTISPTNNTLTVEQNWFDNSSTDFGGGLAIRGNAPTMQFIDADETSYRYMIHNNGNILSFYTRPNGGAWNHIAYMNQSGLTVNNSGVKTSCVGNCF